ncbi:MAG: DeoR/GlpR family DNA-binding transcription regulator [Deinococcota bacterium]
MTHASSESNQDPSDVHDAALEDVQGSSPSQLSDELLVDSDVTTSVSSGRLLPSERLMQIRKLVSARGVVRVSELAQHFEVSDMTIRRDLSELEKLGAIEKTFGAAVVSEQASFENTVSERMHLHQAQKQAIAELATSFVQDGDTIAIDASTTGLALAQALYQRPINVVTNGLDVAQALRGGAASVLMTGGALRERSGSFLGPLAVHALQEIRVDKAFLSAKGVLIPDGLLDSDLGEVDVKRAMLRSAAVGVALVDSSKFGKRAIGMITDLQGVTHLISDSGLSATDHAALEPFTQVHIAHVSGEGSILGS